MGQQSAIQWTDNTFNPWWGCTKISPGCTNCYAETLALRYRHDVWGPKAGRRFFGAGHWHDPITWNKQAAKTGAKAKVFCGSMCDVFEQHDGLQAEREKIFDLIDATPNLIWQLLTKRPENMLGPMVPPRWRDKWPDNVWAMTSVENQEQAHKRIPHLLAVPASVRGLSIEPLLEQVSIFSVVNNMLGAGLLHWIIIGGESGHGARPCQLAWIRKIIEECRWNNVPCFVKQLGADARDPMPLNLVDAKGGNPAHWPTDLNIRLFPGQCLPT